MGKVKKEAKDLMTRAEIEGSAAEDLKIIKPSEYVLAVDYLQRNKGLQAEINGPLRHSRLGLSIPNPYSF